MRMGFLAAGPGSKARGMERAGYPSECVATLRRRPRTRIPVLVAAPEQPARGRPAEVGLPKGRVYPGQAEG